MPGLLLQPFILRLVGFHLYCNHNSLTSWHLHQLLLTTALIFKPLSSSFACLLSGRLCMLSTYGIDCLQSCISSRLIIPFPNVDSCVSGLIFYSLLFVFLSFSFFSRPLNPCILWVLIGSLRGIGGGKKTRSSISIHSQRQCGAFDISQVWESQARAKPWCSPLHSRWN